METLCNSRAVCVSAILTFAAILPFASARPSQDHASHSTVKPLKFDLPPGRWIGTPPNLTRIPNIEPLCKTPRPPFYAP
ncbi:MAG: hypothetical protein J7M40_01400, partial [Planctomycetes bacterium]|nr:hypothetical protein [Planctomycetota bacterium]